MADNVNPGSALGDFVEEFKKAPTAGKIAIVGVVVAVIGIALYMRKKASASASTPVSGLTSGGASNNGTSGGGSSTAPAPIVPGNPAQPTPTTPVQGGGKPPTKPITQPKLPAVGSKPAPKPIVARSPQSTYKQPAKPAAPAPTKPKPTPQGVHRPGGNYGIVVPAPPPPDYTKANAPYVHPIHGPF